MAAHRCSAPTPPGPCQHPIMPPAKRCWQHDGRSIVIPAETVWSRPPDGSNQPPPVIWQYDECALEVRDGALQLVCFTHSQGAWGVAQAMGAEPPCEGYQEQMRLALMGRANDMPVALRPMVEHALRQVPIYAIDSRGEVVPSYFEEGQLTPVDQSLLRKWHVDKPSPASTRAVQWLEDNNVTTNSWSQFHNVDALNPARVVALVKAGVDPAELDKYDLALPTTLNQTHRVKFLRSIGPTRLAKLMQTLSAEQLHQFQDTGCIPAEGYFDEETALIPFIDAVTAGLTPEEFKQMGDRWHQVSAADLRQWLQDHASQ